MKIRNHRKREWWFFAPEYSKLKKSAYRFKYKSSLMNFLKGNLYEVLNGEVRLEESAFGHSGCTRMWTVWINDRAYDAGAKIKIELRQVLFRGRKYVFKSQEVSKEDKKYFAFSDKVISAMSDIKDENGVITAQKAQKLVELFKKRGFKDFIPDADDLAYINGHIGDGIDFSYWSDRCNWLRTKTIIEYFKKERLLDDKTLKNLL